MRHISPASQRPTLPMLIGGGTALAAALLTRLAVGTPVTVVHKLEAFLPLPPAWLLGLLWLALLALAGAAAGDVLSSSCVSPRAEALAWRGATMLVLAVVLSLVWYTLLFGKFFLLASWLCLLPAAAAALLCAASWMTLRRTAAVAVLGLSLWHIFQFVLQFVVLLHV